MLKSMNLLSFISQDPPSPLHGKALGVPMWNFRGQLQHAQKPLQGGSGGLGFPETSTELTILSGSLGSL